MKRAATFAVLLAWCATLLALRGWALLLGYIALHVLAEESEGTRYTSRRA